MPDPSQMPRIALMGEFSAGKSTLTNLLLGSRPLPVKVTATRLPPVWISHGPEQAQVQMADGTVQDIAPAALDRVPLAQARRIDLRTRLRAYLGPDAAHDRRTEDQGVPEPLTDAASLRRFERSSHEIRRARPGPDSL